MRIWSGALPYEEVSYRCVKKGIRHFALWGVSSGCVSIRALGDFTSVFEKRKASGAPKTCPLY